ncbi:hypothetical protein [[Clostridium] scindens]|nr:hypothetical protein [[Clostridium] scindens]
MKLVCFFTIGLSVHPKYLARSKENRLLAVRVLSTDCQKPYRLRL